MEICDGQDNDSLFLFEYREATEEDIADDNKEYERQTREYETQIDDPSIDPNHSDL